ncbi:helix-turn-helix domain-containing protein [Actinokineospora xionganensis]|uniref:Helix-turn-helix domain-containing protein n=1 Tax=Actinokineospora xionganensis TaxID=2684470 RepID=A0ABR7LG40_9PSEU|nr:helix-turn-helix transcriptional regulator [Actinokineospora xionganensis]MBC6451607.1 helix-turn-helix domain-containing protein [Actinokineospora xionganensis]
MVIELLGEELRGHREEAGLSLSEVTARTGISTSKLSRMENGRKAQKADDVAALLKVYGVQGCRRDDLLALAHGTEGSQVASLRVLESKATMIVDYEQAIVPTLLQTVPYAQAALREVTMVDEAALEEQYTNRLRRQAILRRAHPPRFFAIIAETALHTAVGGQEVMREQIRYLGEAASRPNVTIRIVPDLTHGHPGLGGSFQRMQFRSRGAVVVLENRTSSVVIEDTAQVRVYDRIVVELLSVALTRDESLTLLEKLS